MPTSVDAYTVGALKEWFDDRDLAIDDDVFDLFLQKQQSAQSYVPQGYFPPYEAV